jgi:hypothetical protein
MNATVTQEEIDEILSHFSLRQMEQLTTLAMREALMLCPTARLIRAKQPTGEICIGIVDGKQLLTDWQPYTTNKKQIFDLWLDAKVQLVSQSKLHLAWVNPTIGRA